MYIIGDKVTHKSYEQLLAKVLREGLPKGDRTGVGTLSLLGGQIRYDLSKGFPLITSKKVFHKAVFYELLWLLSGSDSIKFLVDHDVKIWNEWAFERYYREAGITLPQKYTPEYAAEMATYIDRVKNDDAFAAKHSSLGPLYGVQWRAWVGADGKKVDQIADVIDQIKTNPDSRRLIVSAWNVTDVPDMALAPCHAFFQFYVNEGKLSLQLYQRSADMFLGVPFNIASYSLLIHMFAYLCDLEVGEFVWTGGDVHIYDFHVGAVKEQLGRADEHGKFPALPTLAIVPTITVVDGEEVETWPSTIDEFTYENFKVNDYAPHPSIKGVVAV